MEKQPLSVMMKFAKGLWHLYSLLLLQNYSGNFDKQVGDSSIIENSGL